jgi:hypothetical protein
MKRRDEVGIWNYCVYMASLATEAGVDLSSVQ